jgi:hypothetical protein
MLPRGTLTKSVLQDRKTMKHAELMIEVTRQLAPRFDPNPAKIKKRIEALIEVGCLSPLISFGLLLISSPCSENTSRGRRGICERTCTLPERSSIQVLLFYSICITPAPLQVSLLFPARTLLPVVVFCRPIPLFLSYTFAPLSHIMSRMSPDHERLFDPSSQPSACLVWRSQSSGP